ncbi:MAG TPA: hypothetical protein VKQ11_05300 [Candidatus Sulfotelmatobacter sp.]|nr:hypothetical protein [Candidatus Sulfotelmatobacter sp.]
MSFRRVSELAALAVALLICVACGDVYRPVVIPINTIPPNPQNFHAVFAISTNAPGNPGTAQQIDVSGDSSIGVANMGVNPTHAAILPNNQRVFVANAAGDPCNGVDVISSFTPAGDSPIATGLNNPINFTLPNVGTGQSASSGISAISEAGNLVTVTLSTPIANAVAGASIVISNVVIPGGGANAFAYNGCFPIVAASGTTIQYVDSTAALTSTAGGTATLPAFCRYLPDYVATTQTNAVYEANYGSEGDPNCNLPSTDSVASLSPATNTVTQIGYLAAGSHPIAMAETANAQNLYVLNQGTDSLGNHTITDISPTDLSTIASIATGTTPGSTPIWAAARGDNQRVYALTQGDIATQESGKLLAIDTVSNTILPAQASLSQVGVAANFLLYDPHLNRLYVTSGGIPNPTAANSGDAAVYVFSTTGGTDSAGAANDTPTLLMKIPMTIGSTACPGGCQPVSVAALPDGSRFYVASYRSETNCADPAVGAANPCMIPMLTIFDALSMTVKPATSPLAPSMSLLTSPQFAASQYAVPTVASCVPPTPYVPGPGSTRFRMFTAASADSSHVYVSICDAGVIADISAVSSSIAAGATNTPDTLVSDVPTPFSAASPSPSGEPPTQNPVFLLTGQ